MRQKAFCVSVAFSRLGPPEFRRLRNRHANLVFTLRLASGRARLVAARY